MDRLYRERVALDGEVDLDRLVGIHRILARKMQSTGEFVHIELSDGAITGTSFLDTLRQLEPADEIERVSLTLLARRPDRLTVEVKWHREQVGSVEVAGRDDTRVLGFAAWLTRRIERSPIERDPPSTPTRRDRLTGWWRDVSINVAGAVLGAWFLAIASVCWALFH
jgi:hypothetical protein